MQIKSKLVALSLLTSVLAFAGNAFAKGPWFDGKFKGAYPALQDGFITIEFVQNEVKSIKIDGQNQQFTIDKAAMTYSTHYDYDWTFVNDVEAESDASNSFKAKLVAGQGMVAQAVLILPSGVQVTLKRQ